MINSYGRIRVNVTGARGAIGLTIQGTPTAGQYIAFGANPREVYPSAGTGADAGLRTDLAAQSGTALSGFIQSGTGAVKLSAQDKLRQARTAKDFGATGVLAQNDLPAIQAHFDVEGPYAANRGGTATLNKGRYRLGTSILLKSYSEFKGEGARTSILDQQDAPVAYPAFKWDYAGIQYGFACTSDLGIRGFSHGFFVTQDTDEFSIRRVHIYGCSTAGVQVNGMLQTGTFDEVKIESCATGIISNSGVCNAMRFVKCDTKNIPGEHVKLNGAEDTTFVSHRFEGGGVVGGITVNLANVKQLTFDAGYMESTHEYAARIVNTTGVITFRNFHFTGTGARAEGGAGPYKWLTDGKGGLVFDCCDSTYPMRVPAHAEIRGACPGLLRCTYRGQDFTVPRNITTSTNFALVKFTRLNAAADNGNITTLSGILKLLVTYVDANGNYSRLDRTAKVSVIGRGSVMTINATNMTTDDTGVTVSTTNYNSSIASDGKSGFLTVNLAPLAVGVPVFQAEWSIEWDQQCLVDQNTFAVELQ